MLPNSGAVPVVIKSLIFPDHRRARQGLAARAAGFGALILPVIYIVDRSPLRFCVPSLIALEEIPMRALSSLRPARNLHAPSAVAGALLLVTGVGVSAACAAEHTLMPSPQTVHIGYFLAT